MVYRAGVWPVHVNVNFFRFGGSDDYVKNKMGCIIDGVVGFGCAGRYDNISKWC